MTVPEWIMAVALPVQLLCSIAIVRNVRAVERSWKQVAETTAETERVLNGMPSPAQETSRD